MVFLMILPFAGDPFHLDGRPFLVFFSDIDFLMHFGRPLAPFGRPFGSPWAPFGFLLAPFGVFSSLWRSFRSLLAPFGALLAPFGGSLAHFWPLLKFFGDSRFHFCAFWIPFVTLRVLLEDVSCFSYYFHDFFACFYDFSRSR